MVMATAVDAKSMVCGRRILEVGSLFSCIVIGNYSWLALMFRVEI